MPFLFSNGWLYAGHIDEPLVLAIRYHLARTLTTILPSITHHSRSARIPLVVFSDIGSVISRSCLPESSESRSNRQRSARGDHPSEPLTPSLATHQRLPIEWWSQGIYPLDFLPISYSPDYCTSRTVVLFLFGRMRRYGDHLLVSSKATDDRPGRLSSDRARQTFRQRYYRVHRYCRRIDDLSLEVLLHYASHEGCVQNGIDISSDGPSPTETRQSLSSQNLPEGLADALPLRSAHETRVNKMIPAVTSLTERCGPDACPSVRIGSHVPGGADA
jgi:hypothetical protein